MRPLQLMSFVTECSAAGTQPVKPASVHLCEPSQGIWHRRISASAVDMHMRVPLNSYPDFHGGQRGAMGH